MPTHPNIALLIKIKKAMTDVSGESVSSFFSQEGKDIDVNNFAFFDGETIVTYACANCKPKVVLALFSVLPAIDISVKNIIGESILQKILSKRRISIDLCKVVLKKMADKSLTVSAAEMQIAEKRQIRIDGAENKEGCEAYRLLVMHNKKLQQQATETTVTSALLITTMLATTSTTAPAATSTATPTIISAETDAQIETIQRKRKAEQLLSAFNAFTPLYTQCKKLRAELFRIQVNVSEVLGDETLAEVIERDDALAPGLKATVQAALQLIEKPATTTSAAVNPALDTAQQVTTLEPEYLELLPEGLNLETLFSASEHTLAP